MNRSRHSLLWGGLLILLGLILLLETFGVIHFVSRLVWSLILISIGLPFLLVYLANRSQWWALIPGCTLAGVGAGVLVGGTLTAVIITASISLPFWLIYLTDRDNNWWALIPGWVMACVSTIILLAWIGLEWFIAPFVMFAIAAPFLLVYLLHREQWWALIPGGIMAIIGVFLLFAQTLRVAFLWPVVLILLGLGFIYRAFRPRPAAPPSPSIFAEPGEPDPAAQPDEPR